METINYIPAGRTKACSVCSAIKPVGDFPLRRASKDGFGYTCKSCAVENASRWRQNNREAHRAYSREWSKAHREHQTERLREWSKNNRDKRSKVCREWGLRNPDKRAAAVARRRARLVTPVWANKSEIGKFYKEAKILEKANGVKYHVDHIVPINSPLVCGLHVECNLQVIPASENVVKRNLYWPDMP